MKKCFNEVMEKQEKRSPIKEEDIARQPGQYLRGKLIDSLFDFLFWAFVAAFAVAIAVFQLVFYFTQTPSSPWLAIILAIIAAVLIFKKYRKFDYDSKKIILGYDGEIFVGQILEGLRSTGHTPIHDVPCENNGARFNIDHVIVGPKGVFVVETKTWSKGGGVEEAIDYSNERLVINGAQRDIEPIKQSKRNAEWFASLLEKRTGEHFSVSPILVFPGWFVKPNAQSEVKNKHGVLMLNPKAVGAFLGNYPDTLNNEQVARLTMVISAYVHEEASREEK